MDLGKLLSGLSADDATQALGFLTANKDDLLRLLQFVKDLPEEVLGVIGQLPGILHALGDGLAKAGEQANNAAKALVGEDGNGGARHVLNSSADRMSGAKDQLGKAAGLLSDLAGDFDEIAIPNVAPKFTKVAGIPVISGLDLSSIKPLDPAARKLTEGSAMVNGVAGDLDSLAGSLRDISAVLATVGSAFAGLGDRLTDSGGAVRDVLGTA